MRVKVCCTCKKFCAIYPNNYESIKRVLTFENKHKGHSLETMDLSELEQKTVKCKFEIEKMK